MSIFYQPLDGFVGDIIPFFWKGQYHVFYLKAPLPPLRDEAKHTAYAHVVSSDLLHWEEWPLAIQPGSEGEPDSVSCWTGSLIESSGIFHLFYTGYSGEQKPQVICHATSSNLREWEKDPANPILQADLRWYDPSDWRDPFVFWNAQVREFWMLLAARTKDGPNNRRGCIALATSLDLQHWEIRPPFWSPSLFYTHECPDLFYWYGKWVLVFSEFSQSRITRYRIAESLEGPWITPYNDTFDTCSFYAAKTASDKSLRFAFGWNPTHEGQKDDGRLQWGGNMIIHELRPPVNRDIPVCAVSNLLEVFREPLPLSMKPIIGKWDANGGSISSNAEGGFAAALLGEMPDPCIINVTMSCSIDTHTCGIFLRADKNLESYYQLRWEPSRRRIVLDRWPRPGDQPYMYERPIEIDAGDPIHFSVVVEGTNLVAYINDEVALTSRMYDHPNGSIGLFISEGRAIFSNIILCGRGYWG